MPRVRPTPFRMNPLHPVREPFKDVAKTFPLKAADLRRVDKFVSGISKAVAVQSDSRNGAFTTKRKAPGLPVSADKQLAIESGHPRRNSPKKATRRRFKRARRRSSRRLAAKTTRVRKKIRVVRIGDVVVPIPDRTKSVSSIKYNIVLPSLIRRRRVAARKT